MKQATGSNTPQSINKVSIQLTLDGHSFSAPALSGEFPGDGPVEVELLTPLTMLVPEELFDKEHAGEVLAAAGMAAGNLNPDWARAYLEMADAADRLDAMTARCSVPPLLVGLAGAAFERFVLRKVHKFGHVPELLVTFGLSYVVLELVQLVWGRTAVEIGRAHV